VAVRAEATPFHSESKSESACAELHSARMWIETSGYCRLFVSYRQILRGPSEISPTASGGPVLSRRPHTCVSFRNGVPSKS